MFSPTNSSCNDLVDCLFFLVCLSLTTNLYKNFLKKRLGLLLLAIPLTHKPKNFILKKNYAECNFGKGKNLIIKYNGRGKISADISFKNSIIKLKSLENLKIYKKKSKINEYNEFKYNRFKPGILNVVKHIVGNKKNSQDLPKIKNIKKLYKTISHLPY